MHTGGAEMTYDYFKNVHGRNSFDNNGSITYLFTHYGINYENAFWDGYQLMFGDGYTTFDILTSLDVIAHEFGHGVCQYSANLNYSYESGALNEGLSDIWGACVEHYAAPEKQTWQIGEDIDLATNHTGLRSMSNPKSKNQPDTYHGTNWYYSSGDNGGLHYNSGVINHWFYLLSVGGEGTNDLSNPYWVPSIGIDNAAAIVYRAETVYFTSTTSYSDARDYTIQAAIDLFGDKCYYVDAVKNAWYAVGIGNGKLLNYDLSYPSSITLSADYSYGFYNSILTTAFIVQPNVKVEMYSTEQVNLVNGFTASAGSDVHFYISQCTDIEVPSLLSASINENNAVQENDDPKPSGNLEKKITVYPNPISNVVNVNFQNYEGQKTVKIYDTLGREINTFSSSDNKLEINVSSLSKGLYILNAYDEDNELIHNQKIIKE